MRNIDWMQAFATAHTRSWPTASMSISASKPPGEGARNLWVDHRDEIQAAAKAHGYVMVFRSAKIVSFLNRNKRGELFKDAGL